MKKFLVMLYWRGELVKGIWWQTEVESVTMSDIQELAEETLGMYSVECDRIGVEDERGITVAIFTNDGFHEIERIPLINPQEEYVKYLDSKNAVLPIETPEIPQIADLQIACFQVGAIPARLIKKTP